MKFDARIQNVLADRLFIDHAIFCVPSRGLETMFTDTVDHFPGCPAADDLIEEVLDNSRLTYGQEYNAWFAVPLTVPTAEQQAIGAVVNAKAPGPLRLYSSFIGLASTQRDFSQLAVGQAIVSPTTPCRVWPVVDQLDATAHIRMLEEELSCIYINLPKDEPGERQWKPGEHGVFIREWANALQG